MITNVHEFEYDKSQRDSDISGSNVDLVYCGNQRKPWKSASSEGLLERTGRDSQKSQDDFVVSPVPTWPIPVDASAYPKLSVLSMQVQSRWFHPFEGC